MNPKFLAFAIVLLAGCKHQSSNPQMIESIQKSVEIENSALQLLLDSANVEGCILVFDLQNLAYHSNNFEMAEKGGLPASTFKIPNSIIALETKVMENDSAIVLWDGNPRRFTSWEKDMTFREAFHLSCVPCYQEIARKIGVSRMKQYLADFGYGEMAVDSTNIDLFWLEGDSKITPSQQIDFLTRFYLSVLPISSESEQIMKRLMVLETNENYVLSAKTGWSIRNGNNNGWFVGYIENHSGVYFFAINVVPKENFNMDMFGMIRKDIAMKALKELGIIH